MKKFLAIFLIAIVACEAVQELELESWIHWIGVGKPKEDKKYIYEHLKKAVKKAVDWLKEHGYYDFIKNKIKELGKAAAVAFCSNYLGYEFCSNAIEGVSELEKKRFYYR